MHAVAADAPDLQRTVPHPPAPQTLEEAGLSLDLLVQLTLKTLHFAGELSGTDLTRRLGLPFGVIDPALDLLKRERHCEIAGGSMLGAPSYRYRITDAGRVRANLFLEHNQYVGVAPVPLEHYRRYMREFERLAPRSATRQRVRAAFADIVLSDRVLDQLGPAVNGGHSMFVYGPPGNGKTVISQRLRKLLDGEIAIPHALEVEGSIIRLFDPVSHEPLPPVERPALVQETAPEDARWVRCRRPLVMVGGELTLKSLELGFDPVAGFYHAPVQALANGGVLVLDDFGRQSCPPRELLNRWIVPLETRVDFLTLQTGQKFDLPFVVLMAFATNIRPTELVDEAFLRRIHYKVFAESPTIDDFLTIWRRVCLDRTLDFDVALVEDLLEVYYRPRGIPLRGCHPRDLIDHAVALAGYLGEPRRLTLDLLLSACDSYFVDDREPAAPGGVPAPDGAPGWPRGGSLPRG